MKTGRRPLAPAALGLALVLLAAVLAACGGGEATAALYHCPMHPTYVADQPGDCPICNMKLVPVTAEEDASMAHGTDTAPPSPAAGPVQFHCPMHPTYISDRPGACPICHMDLVPVGRDDRPETGNATAPEGYSTVRASAEAVHLAGVQTAPAVRDTVGRSIRAVGIVKADETRMHQVNTRVAGWIQKLSVNFTGQFVRRGDPLLTLYSPELMASQEEYLNALEAARRFETSSLPEVRKGAQDLARSARNRLLLYDVPPELLQEVERTGEAQHDVTLNAPATGFVTGKEILAGARIEPGTMLYTIADLSRVWIEAEVYESEASLVRLGSKAVVTLPYDPSFRREARVSYVNPTLDPTTRTLRIRLDLDNSSLALRPDMFADVLVAVEAAQGVVIPDDAVLDSGVRKIVFVETEPGTFEPREIRLGIRSAGVAQVLSGVAIGERVVVKANFLLDSESRLRSAISGPGSGHQHGSAPAPTKSADTESAPSGGGEHGGAP